MARKKVLLHIGPRPSGPTSLHTDLAPHAELLESVEFAPLDAEGGDLERASLEMLREHKSAGLKRKEVEGAWARICRRAFKAKRDLVISQERFHAADADQVPLILDSLMGLETHVVLTTSEDDDTEGMSRAWRDALKKSRFHVVTLEDDAAPVDLAEALVGVALCVQDRELEKKITKLTKRRKRVRREIRLREAS